MFKSISPIFYTGGFTLCKIITGFILVKVIAINLGPAGIVAYGQLQGLVGALNGFIGSPLGNGLIKYTAENCEGGNEACAPWWRASLAWTLLLMIIISAPLLILSKYISIYIFENIEYQWITIAVLFSIPFSLLSILIPSVLNGRLQYKTYSLTGIVANLVSTSISTAVIYHYKSMYALAISIVILFLANGIILSLLIWNQSWFKVKYWVGTFKKSNINGMGKYILMSLTSSICAPLSLILIRSFLINKVGWDLAGYWQAVYRISDVYLSIVTISFSTYFLPRLVRIIDNTELITEIKKMFMIVMPVTIFLGVLVFIFRLEIIKLAFSEEFIKAEGLFSIQIIGDIIKVAGWLLAYIIISKGFNRLYILSEIIFSLLFIILGNIFIDLYGVNGANIAYLTTYILYFMFASASTIYIYNKAK